MNRNLRYIIVAVIIAVIVSLISHDIAYSQSPADTQFQIYIDPTAHLHFGLYYPVTYIFQIPSGSSGLSAQYRFNSNDPWNTLTEYTASNFFNGVNAVRFDYANNLAYLSVAFRLNSDIIYVRILSGGTEVPLAYLGMPLYYDNRHAAATISLDDWDSGSVSDYNDASQILTSAHMHYTAGIITDSPDWSNAQTWINTGYMEPASHSRTHPCDDESYSSTGYDYEITGSRDDILSHLSLPFPYVPVYIEPCGFTSPQVRQAIISAGYLADRGYPLPPVQNTFSSWGADGAYQRVLYSTDTFDWGWGDGTDPAALLATANSNFDAAYNAGGIYHLVDHPWQQHWYSPASTLSQHINYVSNRLDVWYAAFGELYLYHFVQERGLVTVAPQDTIHQVYITNVRDTNFTVSWTTDKMSNGSVDWGVTTGLGNTTSDPITNITTHYVEISGLLPNTTYYFQVRSGATVDNNGGADYTVTTGSSLGGSPGNFLYGGVLYMLDGMTPLQNAIVYLQIQDANGSGSPGNSQWVSVRTETGGAAGVWAYNLSNALIANASNYFSFSAGDQVRIIWQGGSNGCIGKSPDDIRLFTIPDTQPVHIDMVLNGNPTAITLKSFSSHQVHRISLAVFVIIAILGSIIGVAIIGRQLLRGKKELSI